MLALSMLEPMLREMLGEMLEPMLELMLKGMLGKLERTIPGSPHSHSWELLLLFIYYSATTTSTVSILAVLVPLPFGRPRRNSPVTRFASNSAIRN